MPETTATERDARHLSRGPSSWPPGARADEPEPDRRRRGGQGRPRDRRGHHASRRASRTPSAVALDAAAGGPGRGDPVRLARAVLPRRPHAALHGRDPRGRHRARGDRLRRPHAEGRRAAASASCATRACGVDVVDGAIADAARLLNQPFRKHARTGRPLVVFKSAMTLDGKVATRTGDSQWISGEASRARAHRWRAESDAVAVGIGTALADDPQLTARIEGVARQPRRVVFDSEARLPLDSQLVRERRRRAGDRRLLARGLADVRAGARGGRGGRDRGHAARTRARAWRTRSTSWARATSSRCCSRAARTWPAPSSRPARSTRRACSWRR